jgi:hypothetical protein
MCEHSRRRYAACHLQSCRIPVPRMSQLPTNPILAALPERFGNRRISAGFTVDAASGPRRTMTITLSSSLDTSPVISTMRLCCGGAYEMRLRGGRRPSEDEAHAPHSLPSCRRLHQPLLDRRLILDDHFREGFGAGAGRSELKTERTTCHVPSVCFRQICRYLPVSGIAAAPGGESTHW